MAVEICERIGSCNVDRNGSITEQQREFFGQGWIFKVWKAFHGAGGGLCQAEKRTLIKFGRMEYR
ncbi:MAG: hypothetical protein K2I96_00500 [Lachnospiraceae bacterium]|nr:hypothetical protein [Lachnospiraceae bacterium]